MSGGGLDAVVVGAGPNGLAAALALAQLGRSVHVLERAPVPGGGLRTEEVIEPGFQHDRCASVLAFLPVSPLLRRHAAALVTPPRPLAHPFDDGTAVLLERSVTATADRLGADGSAYRGLMEPLAARAPELFADVLGPQPRLPRHPLLAARVAVLGGLPASVLGGTLFRQREARALLAGAAAHSMLPLTSPLTAAFALLMLTSAHHGGWPFALGGARTQAEHLVAEVRELGGEVRCGVDVSRLDQVGPARTVLLDVAPPAAAQLAGTRLSPRAARRLRGFPYGPGVCKVDWTLDGPIPWRAPECASAGTVHLGGTAAEIAAGELEVAHGRHPERPFVLLTQPSLFDPSRAPQGKHVAWGYCHVPNGSDVDVGDRIEAQVERFAPGFGERVRGRRTVTAAELAQLDPNCVGGDIGAGRFRMGRMAVAGPWPNAYRTSVPGVFLCSAATPPGAGVHGMAGWWAAQAAERYLRSRPGDR